MSKKNKGMKQISFAFICYNLNANESFSFDYRENIVDFREKKNVTFGKNKSHDFNEMKTYAKKIKNIFKKHIF